MMVTRSWNQIIRGQYWVLHSIDSTTNMNMHFWMQRLGCWMPIWFPQWKMTGSLVFRNRFLAYLEMTFWCTWFGQYGGFWGDGVTFRICQECWSQMKWASERHYPQWQWLWYAKSRLRRFLWGCCCQFCGRIAITNGWIWHRKTIPELLVKIECGIQCCDHSTCPSAFSRSSQLHLRGIKSLLQLLNQ